MSPIELGETKSQVEKFLEQGFVRSSSSPWSAPVLFAPCAEQDDLQKLQIIKTIKFGPSNSIRTTELKPNQYQKITFNMEFGSSSAKIDKRNVINFHAWKEKIKHLRRLGRFSSLTPIRVSLSSSSSSLQFFC